MTKQSSLLRFFKSDFFNTWIAVSYLFKYPDSGIQEYLCMRLQELPLEDIEFLLPQLCHLLISRITEAISLEFFLLDLCKASTHIAILTLWYLESYQHDYQSSKKLYISERISRLIHKFQTFLMEHPSKEGDIVDYVRIYPYNTGSLLLGMSCVAGAISAPPIGLEPVKLLALKQGSLCRYISPNTSADGTSIIHSHDLLKRQSLTVAQRNKILTRFPSRPPSLEELYKGKAFSLHRYLDKTRFKPNSRFISPTLDISIGHYFYAEMQFVNSLIDISSRLSRIPREARQKALQAELNLLNHNLPANVCIPLWCKTTARHHHEHHHKVVRISPQDAVILNSAERVPFMILVEVLENESDESFQSLLDHIKDDDEHHPNQNSLSCPNISYNEKIKLSPISKSEHDIAIHRLNVPLHNEYEISDTKNNIQITPTFDIVQDKEDYDFSEKMRTAAILLSQLQSLQSISLEVSQIRSRIIQEMSNLETQRLTAVAAHSILSPKSQSDMELEKSLSKSDIQGNIEDIEMSIHEKKEQIIIHSTSILAKEDPSALVFQESWANKIERIRSSSRFGSRSNWKLLSVIVKADSDLRQEQLAVQIILEMKRIWEQEKVSAWVYYYKVLVTGDRGGLIETITDSISLHSIKKQAMIKKKPIAVNDDSYSLLCHFIKRFGTMDSEMFKRAQRCFMMSLVGYSMVTWILALKDRHNGNILLDNQGHLIHIDFGFMLSNSPGYVGFESAPFKLTIEYIELLGGINSELFLEFKALLLKSFMALRKHSENIIMMVEMMVKDSRLACFYSGEAAIQHLRERFQLGLTDIQVSEFIDRLITSSSFNMFTRLYDTFQYYSNGIL